MPSVEHVRWAKFRVVVTAGVSLAILSTLVVLLTGGTLLQPHSMLYVYIPDATGLAPGSPVRVDGIQVGKVDQVLLSGSAEPNRVVRVSMLVQRNQLRSITIDSTAQPAADTLVGDKFIQISTGKSLERVQPGAEIPFKGSTDLMTSLDLSQFRKNIDQMDAMLTDIENSRNSLGEFIMTDTMYRDLLHRVTELEAGVHAAANTASAVGHELYTDTLYRQISDLIAHLDDTLARVQSGQGSVGQLLRDNAQFDQAAAQLVSLRRSIAAVRGSEFFTSAASYDASVKGIGTLIRQVDEFNVTPYMATSAVYDNLAGMAKELQGTAKAFREDPKKFLRMRLF
jgi:phospholipid/cholesterol/gamma-HCH transport system substrate-binding protein